METQTVRLEKDKTCKHSYRYATDEEGAAIKNIYVMKTATGEPPPKFVMVQVTGSDSS